jgi:hypothetical protein
LFEAQWVNGLLENESNFLQNTCFQNSALVPSKKVFRFCTTTNEDC